MAEIELKHGKGTVLVDDADYEWLSKYEWRWLGRGYASTKINGVTTLMHRMILGLEGRHRQCDHINNDKLDNRRENLRECNNAENHRNMKKVKRLGKWASRYKGVGRVDGSKINPWYARIRQNYKTHHIGVYPTERLAAIAYNLAARLFFGEFAHLNVIESEPMSAAA